MREKRQKGKFSLSAFSSWAHYFSWDLPSCLVAINTMIPCVHVFTVYKVFQWPQTPDENDLLIIVFWHFNNGSFM